jgi:hypothetical protein
MAMKRREGIPQGAGHVHLRDPDAVGDLVLAQIELEPHAQHRACAAVERSDEVVGEQTVVDGGQRGVGVAEQVEVRRALAVLGGRLRTANFARVPSRRAITIRSPGPSACGAARVASVIRTRPHQRALARSPPTGS